VGAAGCGVAGKDDSPRPEEGAEAGVAASKTMLITCSKSRSRSISGISRICFEQLPEASAARDEAAAQQTEDSNLLRSFSNHLIGNIAHGRVRITLPMATLTHLLDSPLHVTSEGRVSRFAQHFDEPQRLEFYVRRALLEPVYQCILYG
jgi:hypothetical protein